MLDSEGAALFTFAPVFRYIPGLSKDSPPPEPELRDRPSLGPPPSQPEGEELQEPLVIDHPLSSTSCLSEAIKKCLVCPQSLVAIALCGIIRYFILSGFLI